jgi:hypothetical protein
MGANRVMVGNAQLGTPDKRGMAMLRTTLALAVLTLSLTGCSDATESAPEPTPPTTTVATATPATSVACGWLAHNDDVAELRATFPTGTPAESVKGRKLLTVSGALIAVASLEEQASKPGVAVDVADAMFKASDGAAAMHNEVARGNFQPFDIAKFDALLERTIQTCKAAGVEMF